MVTNFEVLREAGLHSVRRFVGAKLELRDGRSTKVPYCAFEPARKASTTDSSTWCDFDTARRAVERGVLPLLGLVLGDGLVGIDLDKCRDTVNGSIEPWGLSIVDAIDSYSELSMSGTGVHILCHGSLPPGRRRTGKRGAFPPVPVAAELEMYDSSRFFVLTGHPLRPGRVEDRTAVLGNVHRTVFGTPVELLLGRNLTDSFDPEDMGPLTGADLPGPGENVPDDEQLVARILSSPQGEKFARLWSGDTSLHAGDHSAADLALCCVLAFWTRCDAPRIDRLFRQSGLNRTKWERRADYRRRTVYQAIASVAAGHLREHSVETVPESVIAE